MAPLTVSAPAPELAKPASVKGEEELYAVAPSPCATKPTTSVFFPLVSLPVSGHLYGELESESRVRFFASGAASNGPANIATTSATSSLELACAAVTPVRLPVAVTLAKNGCTRPAPEFATESGV